MSERAYAVLIVDDEPEVLDALRRALRREGYRIFTTTSPEEALRLCDDEAIDLLISDIDMPVINGNELIARVRERHPDIVRFLLTGRASLLTAIEAINQGEVHRYLTKPWDQEDLRASLRHALARVDELRRANTVARNARLRERIVIELEREHPGITRVDIEGGVYPLDVYAIDKLAEGLVEPHHRVFFSR